MGHTTWLRNHSEIDNGFSSDIDDMVKEKGKTCVSIIVPTHRFGQDRQGDRHEVQSAVFTAKRELDDSDGQLLLAIDSLFQQIDFTKNRDGIGIFVSPHFRKLEKFSFPVTKKIDVNKFFHLHDLLYAENYSLKYYVLDLSKKHVHLFEGVMDHLVEVNDDHFPKEIIDDFEYVKPSRSSSEAGYSHDKSFEKDKSALQKIRLKNHFRLVDKPLAKYLVTKNIPLVLCGAGENISIFMSVTKHANNIKAAISDNYRAAHLHDLELLSWLQIRSFVDAQKSELVSETREKVGQGLAVFGIENVWEAAREGRGLKLLVEKNYAKPAFVTIDGQLSISKPANKSRRCADVVNEIISTVLEKEGQVIIFEKDFLKDEKRIGLILRY